MNSDNSILIPMFIENNKTDNTKDDYTIIDDYCDCDSCDWGCDCDGGGAW